MRFFQTCALPHLRKTSTQDIYARHLRKLSLRHPYVFRFAFGLFVAVLFFPHQVEALILTPVCFRNHDKGVVGEIVFYVRIRVRLDCME